MRAQKLPLVNDMTTYSRTLSLPPADVESVHEFLEKIWDENPHIPLRDQYRFETAFIELTANIISHSIATSAVTCEILIESSDDRIEATVSDNGKLVEFNLDQHTMPDEFAESGRGIPLMKALLDELTFDNSGSKNTWHMSKRFDG